MVMGKYNSAYPFVNEDHESLILTKNLHYGIHTKHKYLTEFRKKEILFNKELNFFKFKSNINH